MKLLKEIIAQVKVSTSWITLVTVLTFFLINLELKKSLKVIKTKTIKRRIKSMEQILKVNLQINKFG